MSQRVPPSESLRPAYSTQLLLRLMGKVMVISSSGKHSLAKWLQDFPVFMLSIAVAFMVADGPDDRQQLHFHSHMC